jgi:type II secretion system protein H
MMSTHSRTKTRRAFTLVELMVVIALIGIMTAMIIPQLAGTYEDALLRSTSRDLVNAFGLAYSRAVSFNQPHRVRIEAASGKYFVEKRIRDHGREEFVPLRDVSGGEGKLDTRISIRFQAEEPAEENVSEFSETPDLAVAFYPDGTADAREVVLQDRQGFRLALRVNPTTARVRVVEVARK